MLLIRMVDETARHAGHADIIRELIDGTGGADSDMLEAARKTYYTKLEQAAEHFRP